METLLDYGLVAVFVALLLAPFGFPIPEDISLLVSGALINYGHSTWLKSLAVVMPAVFWADSTIWFMGRRIGLHPTGWIARVVGAKHIERIERFYRRYGPWTIAICRQIPGMRFAAFFFAGASGVSWPRFFLFNAPAAFINVCIYIWLGNHFADDLQDILRWIDRARYAVLFVIGCLILALVARALRTRQREREAKDKAQDGDQEQ